MSGGYFDYNQYKINDIIDSIERILKDAIKPKPPIVKKEGIAVYKYGKIKNINCKDYCPNYNFIHLESARHYFEKEGFKIIDISDRNFIAQNSENVQYEIRKFEYEEYADGNTYLDYSKDTINEFKNAIKILKQALIYVDRIDWLISGDDGEEEFHKRLKDELNELDDGSNNY